MSKTSLMQQFGFTHCVLRTNVEGVSHEESEVGLQLGTLHFHEAYHVGQTGLLRRILGKKSRLPDPPA